jgi:hypothetical protein
MTIAIHADPQRYTSGYRLMMLGPGQAPATAGPIAERRTPKPSGRIVEPAPIIDPALRDRGETR